MAGCAHRLRLDPRRRRSVVSGVAPLQIEKLKWWFSPSLFRLSFSPFCCGLSPPNFVLARTRGSNARGSGSGGKEGRLAERVGECVRLTASNCALLSRQCLRETERERPVVCLSLV